MLCAVVRMCWSARSLGVGAKTAYSYLCLHPLILCSHLTIILSIIIVIKYNCMRCAGLEIKYSYIPIPKTVLVSYKKLCVVNDTAESVWIFFKYKNRRNILYLQNLDNEIRVLIIRKNIVQKLCELSLYQGSRVCELSLYQGSRVNKSNPCILNKRPGINIFLLFVTEK